MAVCSATSLPTLMIVRSGSGHLLPVLEVLVLLAADVDEHGGHAEVDHLRVDPLVVRQREGLELLGGDELVRLGRGAVEGR